MGKKTSVYISELDAQRLAASGLSLVDVLRKGFEAIEAAVPPPKGSRAPAPRPTPKRLATSRGGPADACAPPRPGKTFNCPHPPSRVHKGMCGACGQGGL